MTDRLHPDQIRWALANRKSRTPDTRRRAAWILAARRRYLRTQAAMPQRRKKARPGKERKR